MVPVGTQHKGFLKRSKTFLTGTNFLLEGQTKSSGGKFASYVGK
jgi:hypothetical protein